MEFPTKFSYIRSLYTVKAALKIMSRYILSAYVDFLKIGLFIFTNTAVIIRHVSQCITAVQVD